LENNAGIIDAFPGRKVTAHDVRRCWAELLSRADVPRGETLR
jgi:hypothetical protein